MNKRSEIEEHRLRCLAREMIKKNPTLDARRAWLTRYERNNGARARREFEPIVADEFVKMKSDALEKQMASYRKQNEAYKKLAGDAE